MNITPAGLTAAPIGGRTSVTSAIACMWGAAAIHPGGSSASCRVLPPSRIEPRQPRNLISRMGTRFEAASVGDALLRFPQLHAVAEKADDIVSRHRQASQAASRGINLKALETELHAWGVGGPLDGAAHRLDQPPRWLSISGVDCSILSAGIATVVEGRMPPGAITTLIHPLITGHRIRVA